MSTPTQAMLWELMRLNRTEIPLRLAAMCFFAVLVSLIARDQGEIQNQFLRGIAVGMFLVTSPFSSAWLGELDSKSKGFSFRLGYVRPVSTLRLVLIPLSFTVMTSMACYLIPALFVSYLWKANLPLLGPALLTALVVQLSTAVVWSFTSRLAKTFGIVLLAAVVIGLAAYFALRRDSNLPLLLAISDPSYFEMSWLQYASILIFMLMTTVATVIAVDRQRHGDDWEFFKVFRRTELSQFPCPTPDRIGSNSSALAELNWQPFPNRLLAQCWYEWRQFGSKVVIAGAITAGVVVLLLVLCNLAYPGRNPNTVTWAIALALSPFLFLVMGVEGSVGLNHVHGTTRLSLFDATRCLSNDQVIFIKLIVIAACSLVAWLCMLTIAWIDLSLIGRGDAWQVNHMVSKTVAETLSKITAELGVSGWIVGACNVVLLFISSSSGLLAFGLWLPVYAKRFTAVAFVGAMHLLAFVWAIVNKWPVEPALIVYGYLLAGLILFLCVASIGRSLGLGAVRRSYLGAVGCLWAISVVSAALMYVKVSPQLPFVIPTAGLVFAASLLMIPLATTAIAPLAYTTHRNG